MLKTCNQPKIFYGDSTSATWGAARARSSVAPGPAPAMPRPRALRRALGRWVELERTRRVVSE